jgi:hypothetical protein
LHTPASHFFLTQDKYEDKYEKKYKKYDDKVRARFWGGGVLDTYGQAGWRGSVV